MKKSDFNRAFHYLVLLAGMVAVFSDFSFAGSNSKPVQNHLVASAQENKDSLALVALYHATGGPNWKNKTNWLTGPLHTWHGVTYAYGQVREIVLWNNGLAGTLPPEIWNLTNIDRINLGINQISGVIPAGIGNLAKLKDLNLERNQLSGSLPAEIGNLSLLHTLNLSGNQFSGRVPDEIKNLLSLSTLNISENKFSYLPDLSTLPKLFQLICFKNQLTFADLEPNMGIKNFTYFGQEIYFGQKKDTIVLLGQDILHNVQMGGVHNNYQWYKWTLGAEVELTGQTSATLLIQNAKHTDGKEYYCKVTNTVVPNMTFISNTLRVNIHDPVKLYNDSTALVAFYHATNGPGWKNNTNWLSGPLGKWFGINIENSCVTGISLPNNNLSGSIPPEIGNLTSLIGINLSMNQIQGPIPAEIGKLSELQYLSLPRNRLVGAIPDEITELTNLITLNLSENQLNGALPSSLKVMTKLKFLEIQKNMMDGAFPADAGNMSSLARLDISYNKFSNLPNVTTLPSLGYLDCSNNRLSFSDLEPNMGIRTFRYTPQDSLGNRFDTTLYAGKKFSFQLITGGENNQYQWFKDGAPLVDQTSASLDFSKIQHSDSGSYFCQVTNSLVTGLTLVSRIIRLHIVDLPVPVLNYPSGSDIVWTVDSAIQIVWQDFTDPFLKIELLKGEEVFLVVADSVANTGTFNWKVPALAPGSNYRIRITSLADPAISQISKNPFAIEPPPPVLEVNPTSLFFGETEIESHSSHKSYMLTGRNLTGEVLVNAPSGFQISISLPGEWKSSLVVAPDSGRVNTTIHARFSPEIVGAFTGDITHSSAGVLSLKVTLSGTGIEIPLIPISQVQGSGITSPLIDSKRRIQGTVTGVVKGLGYFIQDANSPWSGIWVDDPSLTVAVGDGIEIKGVVAEINGVTSIVGNGRVIASPLAVSPVILASPMDARQEKYESVVVRLTGVRAGHKYKDGTWKLYTSLSDTLTFGNLFFESTLIEGNFYSVTGIINGINNFFKLEPGKVSDVVDLTKTSVNSLSDERMISVYPNPFKDNVSIEIWLKEPSSVQIEIFTTSGMKLAVLNKEHAEAHVPVRLGFKPGGLPGQVLLYRIRTGDAITTGKLLYKP